jgi:ribosomal protein S14
MNWCFPGPCHVRVDISRVGANGVALVAAEALMARDIGAVPPKLGDPERDALDRPLARDESDGVQPKLRPPARKPRKPAPQERCGVGQAAAILGLSNRKIQDMASRGEIPGAAKFARVWTFDVEKLRRHVQLKERQAWQSGKRLPGAIGAAMPYGGAPRSMDANSGGRFTRVTQRLRGQGARRDRIG